MSEKGKFLLYTAREGAVKVEVFFENETVWLTQKALAELFGVKVPAINKHLRNIFESGELTREATISKMEIVRPEGLREVTRDVEFYNLDAIIAVGYRVNSYQATQFRIWAPFLAEASTVDVRFPFRHKSPSPTLRPKNL